MQLWYSRDVPSSDIVQTCQAVILSERGNSTNVSSSNILPTCQAVILYQRAKQQWYSMNVPSSDTHCSCSTGPRYVEVCTKGLQLCSPISVKGPTEKVFCTIFHCRVCNYDHSWYFHSRAADMYSAYILYFIQGADRTSSFAPHIWTNGQGFRQMSSWGKRMKGIVWKIRRRPFQTINSHGILVLSLIAWEWSYESQSLTTETVAANWCTTNSCVYKKVLCPKRWSGWYQTNRTSSCSPA